MKDVYRALSDVHRRRILALLSEGPRSQSEIVKEFTISQPAVFKHLQILKEEGLIAESRQGRFCYYSLNREMLGDAYANIRRELETLLEDRLTRLKLHLEGTGTANDTEEENERD